MILRRDALLFLGLLSSATLALPSCKRTSAPASASVKLYVDEREVGTIAVTTSPTLLASHLSGAAADPATWRRIEGQATGGRFLDVRNPVATYQNGETRLYLQQGQPALGIFRPVRDGLPEHVEEIARQPAVSVTDVVEVRIHTKDPPPMKIAMLVVEATGLPSWTMEPGDLDELPETEEAAGASRARGRRLRDIARFRVTGTIDRVVIEGRDGRLHTVTAAELDDPTTSLLVKVNNKNQWVFKSWSGAEATVDIHDLARLRIEGTDLRGRGGRGDGTGDGGAARK